MRILRYLQTGYLLHLITILSTFLLYFCSAELFALMNSQGKFWKLILFGYLTGYFFSLLFFSQLDARSRYQNYKMAKDKLFEYGFDIRLLRPFVYSRCQRDAIMIAAIELNYSTEWKTMIYAFGFRWYHLLPHLVIKKPMILLTRDYWNKTLFVKFYQSKYFLW